MNNSKSIFLRYFAICSAVILVSFCCLGTVLLLVSSRFLGYTQAEVEQYLSKEEITLSGDYLVTVGDRGEQLDVSPLELHFEKSFSNTYGKRWKKRVGYQVLYKMNL